MFNIWRIYFMILHTWTFFSIPIVLQYFVIIKTLEDLFKTQDPSCSNSICSLGGWVTMIVVWGWGVWACGLTWIMGVAIWEVCGDGGREEYMTPSKFLTIWYKALVSTYSSGKDGSGRGVWRSTNNIWTRYKIITLQNLSIFCLSFWKIFFINNFCSLLRLFPLSNNFLLSQDSTILLITLPFQLIPQVTLPSLKHLLAFP